MYIKKIMPQHFLTSNFIMYKLLRYSIMTLSLFSCLSTNPNNYTFSQQHFKTVKIVISIHSVTASWRKR